MSSNAEFGGISFDLPKNKSNVIKVIGVGGGGSNAARMCLMCLLELSNTQNVFRLQILNVIRQTNFAFQEHSVGVRTWLA